MSAVLSHFPKVLSFVALPPRRDFLTHTSLIKSIRVGRRTRLPATAHIRLVLEGIQCRLPCMAMSLLDGVPRTFIFSRREAFTLVEILVVVAIIITLASLIFPLVMMLKESSRRQQAHAIITQISDAIFEYQSEDQQRNFPPTESDFFIRMDPNQVTSIHLLNILTNMQLDGGLHPRVRDPSGNGTLVLIDPWRRPYRYQVDNTNASSPTQIAIPTRPDPQKLDWNAKGYVPFAYVWSLGSPVHGNSGDWLNDPDAVPGSGAIWIYPTTAQ